MMMTMMMMATTSTMMTTTTTKMTMVLMTTMMTMMMMMMMTNKNLQKNPREDEEHAVSDVRRDHSDLITGGRRSDAADTDRTGHWSWGE